ncbi:MAG: tetratricopeptide repeat protein [Myxococcota bacterium]
MRSNNEKIASFMQGDLVLADLYGIKNAELYQIAAQGKRLFEEGQEDKALQIFLGLTALDPYDYSFHVGLGAVYQKAGQLDRALVEYDRAVSLNERSIAALANRAEVLVEQGEVERAVQDLTRIRALDPEAKDPHSRRAQALVSALLASVPRAG